nr:unnamed protein product [Leishmania braziliensis]
MRRVASTHCVTQRLGAPLWVHASSHRIVKEGIGACGSGVQLHGMRLYSTRAKTSVGGAYGTSDARDDYYNQVKEDKEDQLLEDEEFAALRDADSDEPMSVTHRLAHKADALDAELRRIRYCLCDRAQFLVDTAPATFSGRPTQVDKVLKRLKGAGNQQQSDGAAAKSPRNGTPAAIVAAALRASPYAAWHGTSDPVLRFLSLRLLWPRAGQAGRSAFHGGAPSHGAELATLEADLDYLRRGRSLNQLNYYSRLNLTPKRHIWMSLYQIMWNCVVSSQDAVGCVVFGTLRGMKGHGVVQGACKGTAIGLIKALEFLCYGWVVSPLLHLSRGLCNTLYGPVNSITGKYMFDALSGRWMRCTVADSRVFRHELQREKRVLRTVGRAEFRRKRMKVQHRWADCMASMGFRVDMMKDMFMQKGTGGPHGTSAGKEGIGGSNNEMRNPYEVLQVCRTANTQEIKKQYKKLAMVFHPDVAQSHRSGGGPLSPEEKAEAQRKFEEISSAYQVLSNPEKRKAYDFGGAQGVRMHETKFGKFMSRTPAEIVQSVFGGEGFRRVLVGELLRSHWALRNEAQVSVSIHELEELQCIRVRQVAVELAAIADVHAQRPTTPYYRGAPASAGAGGAQGSRRRTTTSSASSSSLPDYLKSGKARCSPIATSSCRGSTSGTGAPADIDMDREMHNSIMEELGGGSGASGSGGKVTLTGQARLSPKGTMSAASSVSSAWSSSPFVLQPGSNEYNCFSRDFEERCDRFVRHMAEACFGKALLYEVGEAYVVGAQRFLGIRPFYAPKMLVTRKVFTGMDRIYEALLDKRQLTPEGMSRKLMVEYFNIEYDTVVADIHCVLRYAVQMVLQDVVESDEVRRKRCYAVWYLGERMMAVGERWTTRIMNDEDLAAYIQQAATAVATTSKPPAF